MLYVSLFSGIEAATVAWEPLGWEAGVTAVARRVFADSYDYMRRYMDFRVEMQTGQTRLEV